MNNFSKKLNDFLIGDALAVGVGAGMLHLVFVYANYLFALNDAPIQNGFFPNFIYFLKFLMSILSAFAFAVTTSAIVMQTRNRWQCLLFAFFDAMGVFIYYSKANFDINQPLFWQAFFISLYAGASLYAVGEINMSRYNEKQALHAQDNENISLLKIELERKNEQEKLLKIEIEDKNLQISQKQNEIFDFQKTNENDNYSIKTQNNLIESLKNQIIQISEKSEIYKKGYWTAEFAQIKRMITLGKIDNANLLISQIPDKDLRQEAEDFIENSVQKVV